MYKGGKIIAALIIFVAFLTFPIFYNLGKANAGPDVPVVQQTATTQCVEPAEYMRANHMQLLNKWRDSFVQQGKTEYVNSQGKTFEISLQSCLQCHSTGTVPNAGGASIPASNTGGVSNPALNTSDQFCVSCHNYASVKPTCWSCHSGPEGATK
ncbi:MAG: sulfate reduction electron transfer complex DsrMKJOP subunit DsrJ [Bacillota bacterium]|nr:sulfate reduction electron transfer complex DsrMKJOP subunit DsrJ [Bacillota bacterium]